ncbi:MAG: sensor histidine kinase [Vicinamibacterales bacterium]
MTTRQELARATELLRLESLNRQRADQARLQLLNRLVFAEEEERRRIAREVHDQCGQDLTALKLQTARLKAECSGHAGLRLQVEVLEAIAAQLDEDIDFLVWELRPTTLDIGLRTALAKYVESWSVHYGIHVELQARGTADDRLTVKIKSTLYRVAQESLTNIAKHARATRVEVVVEACSGYVSLVVEDNGVGFDPGSTGMTGRGLGLLGMQERAALVAGTLQIESAVGRGTTVLLRVPTPAPEQTQSRSQVQAQA